MTRKIFYLTVLCVLFFNLSACNNSNKPFTTSDLVAIYVAHELATPEQAASVEKKYKLDNPKIRQAYYQSINDLSLDETAFKAFLNQVDTYEQIQTANTINALPQGK